MTETETETERESMTVVQWGKQQVDHVVAAGPGVRRHEHAEDQSFCNEARDARRHHTATCEVGGGIAARSNGVRHWLAGWMAMQSG